VTPFYARSASRARRTEISRPREKSFAKCCERLRRWRILAPQRRWNRTLIANEVSVTIHAQLLTVTFHFSGKTIAEVEKLALDLPATEKAILAAHLLGSLPSVLHDEDEGLREALRRDAEFGAKLRKWASIRLSGICTVSRQRRILRWANCPR